MLLLLVRRRIDFYDRLEHKFERLRNFPKNYSNYDWYKFPILVDTSETRCYLDQKDLDRFECLKNSPSSRGRTRESGVGLNSDKRWTGSLIYTACSRSTPRGGNKAAIIIRESILNLRCSTILIIHRCQHNFSISIMTPAGTDRPATVYTQN